RFRLARKDIEVGKISGAVGNFAHVDPMIQKLALEKLGLNEANISTQILQRDLHAFYIQVLSLIASSIEKIAVEIRHLSRTEVNEIEEGFTKNQKGSSAMPHKKNPIASENMAGIARVIRGYVVTANENIALWHERDISHSSAERIIIPDATSLIYYMLNRYQNVLKNLVVKEDQMLKNLSLNYGVFFSQKLLKALIDKNLDRDQAYDIVQKLTFDALKNKVQFEDVVSKDEIILNLLKKEEIKTVFKLEGYLNHLDEIYKSVGI